MLIELNGERVLCIECQWFAEQENGMVGAGKLRCDCPAGVWFSIDGCGDGPFLLREIRGGGGEDQWFGCRCVSVDSGGQFMEYEVGSPRITSSWPLSGK